ncbi:hypothetical protein LSCM4_01159 [Leishmania orientalis]|uniref:Uncharacterized protein n=1 Tax=Leishmania orientalis TaxID=2249476 RepID=A0A836H0C7_9TRYP|nr:hypothetical protein LSCM4_01159 [Leishmania orientalis]
MCGEHDAGVIVRIIGSEVAVPAFVYLYGQKDLCYKALSAVGRVVRTSCNPAASQGYVENAGGAVLLELIMNRCKGCIFVCV